MKLEHYYTIQRKRLLLLELSLSGFVACYRLLMSLNLFFVKTNLVLQPLFQCLYSLPLLQTYN